MVEGFSAGASPIGFRGDVVLAPSFGAGFSFAAGFREVFPTATLGARCGRGTGGLDCSALGCGPRSESMPVVRRRRSPVRTVVARQFLLSAAPAIADRTAQSRRRHFPLRHHRASAWRLQSHQALALALSLLAWVQRPQVSPRLPARRRSSHWRRREALDCPRGLRQRSVVSVR